MESRAVLFTWFAPLFNADGAVRLFFVLSGFVLTHSLRDPGPVVAYWVKRYLRIQLPFAVALVFAWALSFGYIEASGLSRWLGSLSRVHLTVNQLVGSLWIPGEAFGQLSIGWTLRIELLFSLVLPAMIWLARRSHLWALVLVSAVPCVFEMNTSK